MITPLVVVGAGGFGREALDVVVSINAAGSRPRFDLLGVLDDSPSPTDLARLMARGIPHLGTIDAWLKKGQRIDYLIAVGHPPTRRSLAQRFAAAELRAAIAIHPHCVLGTASSVAPGSILCSGVQVSTNVRIGAHVHLNPNATIGHDTVIADYVSINPAATVSGECVLEEGALLGAGGVVLQGLTVGSDAVVGASACVVRNVSPGTRVRGVPAR